jgi:lipopolysaccharide transport system ATP-binding protein
MKTVVRFDNVSKQYHLGVTRTSIVKGIARAAMTAVRPHALAANDQILWALREVSFELAQGESLALIGKNGAGKSTILKLLANITRPTRGNIAVNGRLSALIELGSGFHPDLTGRENVFLNGTVLGLTRDEIRRRFDEIVTFSEIERFIDTPVKRYSSGMMVRLGFAVASCIEPEILLVDEVLAVGDASFRQKCLLRIESLLKRGASIIFVSHNINMVEAVCQTALYIKQGHIEYRGKTAEAIALYEHALHEERVQKYQDDGSADASDPVTGVEITKVKVVDATGVSAREYRADQPVEIQIHYDSRVAHERIDAVIRIVRSDGMTCCMARTAIDNVPIALRAGAGYFSIWLEPLQLIGGAYYVNAYISTPRDLVLLATARSPWFYVAGSPLSFEEQSGVYEPRRRWVAPPADAFIHLQPADVQNV